MPVWFVARITLCTGFRHLIPFASPSATFPLLALCHREPRLQGPDHFLPNTAWRYAAISSDVVHGNAQAANARRTATFACLQSNDASIVRTGSFMSCTFPSITRCARRWSRSSSGSATPEGIYQLLYMSASESHQSAARLYSYGSQSYDRRKSLSNGIAMPYAPFYLTFHELAAAETRCLTAFDDPLPASDRYVLMELYCDESGCGCRRVMFDVYAEARKEFVAVLAYGCETRESASRDGACIG